MWCNLKILNVHSCEVNIYKQIIQNCKKSGNSTILSHNFGFGHWLFLVPIRQQFGFNHFFRRLNSLMHQIQENFIYSSTYNKSLRPGKVNASRFILSPWIRNSKHVSHTEIRKWAYIWRFLIWFYKLIYKSLFSWTSRRTYHCIKNNIQKLGTQKLKHKLPEEKLESLESKKDLALRDDRTCAK
jgi:hypothetical protein